MRAARRTLAQDDRRSGGPGEKNSGWTQGVTQGLDIGMRQQISPRIRNRVRGRIVAGGWMPGQRGARRSTSQSASAPITSAGTRWLGSAA
jgi:hypothetical protein